MFARLLLAQVQPAFADVPLAAFLAGTFVFGDLLQLARAEAVLLLDSSAHIANEDGIGVEHHLRIHRLIPPS